MKKLTKIFLFLVFTIFLDVSEATTWSVPEFLQHIQEMIAYGEVVDGDTVSVRNGTVEEPTIWPENINFLGKNIVVTNRDCLGGNNNPATCIIDGGHHSSVVTINSGETHNAILQGFIIQNGDSTDWGGGIYIDSASPTLTNNIIKNNRSSFIGGGIAVLGIDTLPDFTRPIIVNNIIRDNTASEQGGGIFYQYAKPEINSNKIISNLVANYYGGGISGNNDTNGTYKTQITGNQIDSNAAPEGRALYFSGSNAKLRNNKICHNTNPGTGAGILCLGNITPDFGDIGVNEPGYNLIEDNGYYCIVTNLPLKAEGNFWGTLHTPNITNHINGDVYFDPIAASDRVANVSYNSACSTDVIITGDLTVNQNVTLNVASGKTFKFTTTADTNTGNYNSCELLVHGSLQAFGTEEDKINFTSYATSPQANDWYGIRLRPNSVGKFNNCNVKYGYCGIEAISNDTLLVDSSLIESNQTYGINISQTQFAEIKESEFNGSVYGIKSTSTSPIIANNKFERNASYGIFLEETDDAMILKNYINGLSDAPTLYGIGLAEAGENVYVDSNRIEKWNQAGIYINKESYAQVNKDTIIDNTSYGILCSNSSSPKVRWCQIENNGTGVYCEGNAFPDLGTDTGYNSIDSNNDYYVVNTSETYENVYALNNWWGTEEPNPDKFIGLVKYNPWLSAPPEDGEQSAGIINTTYPFILYAPKPNPASKDVKIVYSLPTQCKTELVIYNAAGQIMTKSVEEKEAGRYEYLWNSREYPNGVYIIRLKANDKLGTQKVVISK